MKQVINSSDQQTHKNPPQIICGAFGDVYKTLFRLLESFGKQKRSQFKRKILKLVKKMKITGKIYYGCVSRYSNSKRELIDFKSCKKRLSPTSNALWLKEILKTGDK